MKRTILSAFVLLVLFATVKAQTCYKELLEMEDLKIYPGNFMTLYETSDKIYAEIPKEYIGRQFLSGTTIVSSDGGDRTYVGYRVSAPRLLQIEMKDSMICFVEPETVIQSSLSDYRVRKALDRNYAPGVFYISTVTWPNNDTTAYVINLKSYIDEIGPWDVRGYIKPYSFEDNVSFIVKHTLHPDSIHYEQTSAPVETVSDNKYRNVVTNTTLLLMPKEKMQKRYFDSYNRVNCNNEEKSKKYLESTYRGFEDKLLLQRWRIQPVDTAAWLRGELTPVSKPIVFYIDDSFPEGWAEPVKRGALRWNKAFERIGLRDVVQVRDVPQDDTLFDINNLKYSTIRYLPIPEENAYGPSWTDPTTGEILNATVLINQGTMNSDYKWRFVQTSQVDPRVRCSQLPKDLFDESLEYSVAHEVGHALGFIHNFASSSAYPVDSLRSATFTRKYGIAASIMDYARYNYVAQPTDTGVTLGNIELGPFDYYAVEWLYKPHPEAQNAEEESRLASQVLDEHEGDPLYRYAYEQLFDPTCMIEDLGDDHIRASDYGISNLKRIVGHIREWCGGDIERTSELYNALLEQRELYIMHVMSLIGGIQVTDVKDTTRVKPFLPVPREQQRRALRWLFDELRNGRWLDVPEYSYIFGLDQKSSSKVPDDYMHLFGYVRLRIALSAQWDSSTRPYTLQEYYNDLFTEMFRSTVANRPLQEPEKYLHRTAISYLTSELIKAPGYKYFSYDESECKTLGGFNLIDNSLTEPDVFRTYMLQRIRTFAQQMKSTGPAADRAHYTYLYIQANKALK